VKKLKKNRHKIEGNFLQLSLVEAMRGAIFPSQDEVKVNCPPHCMATQFPTLDLIFLNQKKIETTFNVKLLGPSDNPIEGSQHFYWLISMVLKLYQ